MAPYKHHVSSHRRARRAKRVRRFAVVGVLLIIGGFAVVGLDLLLSDIRSDETVVSKESRATVESARINIFQTPYFRFQADESWREVTDDPNLLNGPVGSSQYLYRGYNQEFIDHELWVTVNLPPDYKIPRHNVPTRVLPVRIESDGTIAQIGAVSEHCSSTLDPDNPNLRPHVVTQDTISYYCHPNDANSYTVTVGVPGEDNVLTMPHESGTVDITITYRNITQSKQPASLERILRTFQSR